MADENKLLELIGEDEELKTLLTDMTEAAEKGGFEAGKKEGLAEGKKVASESKEPKVKGPEKPKCFKTYKKSYEKHPKKCRACGFAQKCQGKK